MAEWEQEAAVPFLIAVKDSRTHTHTCVHVHIQRECKVSAESLEMLRGQALPQPNSPGCATALGVY